MGVVRGIEIGFLYEALSSCPGILSVDQAGLKLRSPPASASLELELKVCTTTLGCFFLYNN